MDILLNGKPVDALSAIVHKDKAYHYGRSWPGNLRVDPRQLFEVPIQAVVNNKVIARETVRALRKDASQVLRRRCDAETETFEKQRKEETHETVGFGGGAPGGLLPF